MHHLATTHLEKVTCDYCDYMEYPSSYVIRHELLTHLTCSKCRKINASMTDLKEHFRKIHGIENFALKVG